MRLNTFELYKATSLYNCTFEMLVFCNLELLYFGSSNSHNLLKHLKLKFGECYDFKYFLHKCYFSIDEVGKVIPFIPSM